MKISKKLIAVFMALVMALSSGAITAFAAYPTFKSGGHDVSKILTVYTQKAYASTIYTPVKAEYLIAVAVASQYDKNGNKVKLDTKDSYKYDAISSGQAIISCEGTSNKYKTVTSTHAAKYKGYAETASNLTKTVW